MMPYEYPLCNVDQRQELSFDWRVKWACTPLLTK